MDQLTGNHEGSTSDRTSRIHAFVDRAQFSRWFDLLRDRLRRTRYVNGCDVPDEPESPYRARLSRPLEQTPDAAESFDHDVVRGTVRIIYEVRCSCGKRWFNRQLNSLQLCPRCDRAVLLQAPDGVGTPQDDSQDG